MKALLLTLLVVSCVPMNRSHRAPAPQAARPATTSQLETCTFSSDCGEGRSCRADASGTNVCMGGGYAGDPCWFSSDCVSGSCTESVSLIACDIVGTRGLASHEKQTVVPGCLVAACGGDGSTGAAVERRGSIGVLSCDARRSAASRCTRVYAGGARSEELPATEAECQRELESGCEDRSIVQRSARTATRRGRRAVLARDDSGRVTTRRAVARCSRVRKHLRADGGLVQGRVGVQSAVVHVQSAQHLRRSRCIRSGRTAATSSIRTIASRIRHHGALPVGTYAVHLELFRLQQSEAVGRARDVRASSIASSLILEP